MVWGAYGKIISEAPSEQALISWSHLEHVTQANVCREMQDFSYGKPFVADNDAKRKK